MCRQEDDRFLNYAPTLHNRDGNEIELSLSLQLFLFDKHWANSVLRSGIRCIAERDRPGVRYNIKLLEDTGRFWWQLKILRSHFRRATIGGAFRKADVDEQVYDPLRGIE